MSSGDVMPLHAEALVSLEQAGALSGVGLNLSMRPDLSYEAYESIGVLLGRATMALRFAVGDWLVFGEEVFGERAAQASELLGISPEGRMELARIARAIPRAWRRAGLSWGHHRVLAARWIDPDMRRELLDEAERRGWTVRELEGAVREHRALKSGLHVEDAKGACDELIETTAQGLRNGLLACGYADIVVAVEIRTPGIAISYVVGDEEPIA